MLAVDDVGQALFLLFEISTTEGWVDVMFAAVDSTSIHMQPLKNNGLHHWWLFFLFMMLGAFLFMNLFVGVIVTAYNEVQADDTGLRWHLPPQDRRPRRRVL
mgnify:CR=1 FL=1